MFSSWNWSAMLLPQGLSLLLMRYKTQTPAVPMGTCELLWNTRVFILPQSTRKGQKCPQSERGQIRHEVRK